MDFSDAQSLGQSDDTGHSPFATARRQESIGQKADKSGFGVLLKGT
jgi:hypothetical protein